MIFDEIIYHGEANNKYQKFKPGGQKRYPHLDLKLEYNAEIDNYTSIDPSHNAREFLSRDLAIRELMIPSARRLFIKDMLGIPYSDKEKLPALEEVFKWKVPDYKIQTIVPAGFGWDKKVPLHLIEVESIGIFPIGMMAKGTDIAIVDQHSSTHGQEIAHAIYHYSEGISKGNENIIEVHGDPFYVYALQCKKGRGARRIREGQSPHRIKFPDYVCLRAWAGTKIKEGVYHEALGLLAPPMNLVGSLVDENILIKALFDGSSKAIEDSIDNYLGKGAYEEIYMDYDVFGRLKKIIKRSNKCKDTKERMFARPLFKSQLSQDEIQRIWENPGLRNDELIRKIEE